MSALRWLLLSLMLRLSLPAAATDEVPFVITPDAVTVAMLDAAGVGERDHVIDLGSGDGRIVITAARRYGATGLGVEIVPDLVARSRASARQAGVHTRVEFREQDLFETDLSRATVVTLYLLPEVNLQLRPRLLRLAPGTRIVSHDWDMGDWPPDRTVTLPVPDKPIGLDKSSRVHLWVVPAQVHGAWCNATAHLDIRQQFQSFNATLTSPINSTQPVVFGGRIQARSVVAAAGGAPKLELNGETLQVIDGRTTGQAAGSRYSRVSPAGAPCPPAPRTVPLQDGTRR